MRTLLLTGVAGSAAAALIHALGPWRDRIRILGVTEDPQAASGFLCDAVWLTPPASDHAGWMQRMRGILRQARPDLVLPTQAPDLQPLAALAADPGSAGIRFFCPGPAAAAMMTDVQASHDFAAAHGLPFVETATDRPGIAALVARVGFPVLAKPRRGGTPSEIRILRSWDQVDALLGRADVVVQAYLGDRGVLDLPVLDPGRGMPFIHAFGGRRIVSALGAVLPDRSAVFCGAVRTTHRGVLPAAVQRDDDPHIEALVRGLGTALRETDFTGFYGVRAVPQDGGVSLPIGYAGCLTRGLRPARLLGLADAKLVATLVLGEAPRAILAPAPEGIAAAGWGAQLVADGDAHALARDGRWQAPPPVPRRTATPAVLRRQRRTLLLTTCGNAVAAMTIAVLAPWRDRIRIVGLNAEADAAPNFLCDAVHLVPSTQERAAWHARVAGILRAERPDLVLPTRDGDLEPLADLAAAGGMPSALVLAPGPRSAAMMADKHAQHRFARDHGLPFAESAVDLAAAERLVAHTGFPVIAKPRRGTGAQGLRVVRDWEVAGRLLAQDALLQPFVGDRAILDAPGLDPALGMPLLESLDRHRYVSSVGVVLPDRRVLDCGAIENDFVAPQRCRVTRVEDAALTAMTRALGAALAATDFLGFFNLQAVRDRDGAWIPFEYNGRLIGAVLSRRALNLLEMPVLLHLLLGEALPAHPGPSPAGAVMVTPEAAFVAGRDARALARDGVWRSPSAART